MDYDIFHFGVVDGALRTSAPGILGSRVIVVDADQVDGAEVEIEAARILHAAPEYKVKLAHERFASRYFERTSAFASGIEGGLPRTARRFRNVSE